MGFPKGDATAERQASGLHVVCLAGKTFSTLSVTGQNTIASIKQDVIFTDIKGRIANI